MIVRGAALGACLAFLAAAPLWADEEPRAAAVPSPLSAEDWPLLPINDLEKQELARDHPALVRQVQSLVARIRKIESRRSTRKNPDDNGGRRMGDHAADLRTNLAPLLAQAVTALGDKAVNERLLAHIHKAPAGPLRVERYAAGLPLLGDGLPDDVRTLLAFVVPRVQGALTALGSLAAEKDTLQAPLRQRIKQIEKRYWRLIDYIVPEAQRAALHRRLPSAYQRTDSILQHVYALPDLTASQGSRVRAMLEEVQAQAAPDSALVKRLQGAAGKGEGSRDARRRQSEAQQRLMALQRWAVIESRKILSPEQWTSLEAIPPRVSLADRKQTSVQVLSTLTLTPAQRSRLATMRTGLQSYRNAHSERRLKAAARMAGMGPDSPQMERARMAMANVRGAGNVVQREFNGRVLLECLSPAQVTLWVLGPSKRR